jgi:anaerobic ribonucleoside-triphosphate reductase activating protein
MKLRIHRIAERTRVDGPGLRTSVFVQGCPIRCPGCAVPWTWDDSAGAEVDAELVAERFLADKEIEGVTFLGGEPFAQAEALALIGGIAHEAGLSVMTFTGYEHESLVAAGRGDYNRLLEVTDLLIDGPFMKELSDGSRPWVGSSNQRYHFLTQRYASLEPELKSIPNRMEVRLGPDGSVSVNGLVVTEDYLEYMSTLVN